MDMNKMLQQVGQMQEQMQKAQAELADETVEATAGGGMVTVKVSGDLVVKSIAIDPEAIDPEDPELLQDTITAAVNEGIRAAQDMAAGKMEGLTGGLDLDGLGLGGMGGGPGGMGGLGGPGGLPR